jgi:hypothetical protein
VPVPVPGSVLVLVLVLVLMMLIFVGLPVCAQSRYVFKYPAQGAGCNAASRRAFVGALA